MTPPSWQNTDPPTFLSINVKLTNLTPKSDLDFEWKRGEKWVRFLGEKKSEILKLKY